MFVLSYFFQLCAYIGLPGMKGATGFQGRSGEPGLPGQLGVPGVKGKSEGAKTCHKKGSGRVSFCMFNLPWCYL